MAIPRDAGGVRNRRYVAPKKKPYTPPKGFRTEATHPVTRAQQRAIDEVVRNAQTQQLQRSAVQGAQKIARGIKLKQHHDPFDSALHFALNRAADIPGQVILGPTALIPGVRDVSRRVVKTGAVSGVATSRAFLEHPGPVAGRTIKGLGELGIGAIAAIPELGLQTVTGSLEGDPLRGVKKLGSQAAKDYSRRYGAIYRGEPGAVKKFRQRIQKEGAASELVDAATIAVPEGAILGRSAGVLARAGKLGARAGRIATEARPALRVSGEAARPQELSRNLFRAAGQKTQDVVRAKAAARRARQEPVRGLQPREGEVVAATRTAQRRLQRIEQSKIATRGFEGFRNEMTQEVHHGAQREMSKLSRKQQRAVYGVLQGYVDASSPERAIATLQARNAHIIAARKAHDAERAGQKLGPRDYGKGLHEDELKLNQDLIDHAHEVFSDGKLKRFQESESARSIRVARESENAHPAFKSSMAEVRRLRAQGMEFGIEHPYDRLRAEVEKLPEKGGPRLVERPSREVQVYDRKATEKALGRRAGRKEEELRRARAEQTASAEALAAERQKYQAMRGKVQRMIAKREQRLRELEHEDTNISGSGEVARLEDEVFRLEGDLHNLQGAEAWATMKHNIRDTGALKREIQNLPTAHHLPPERATVPARHVRIARVDRATALKRLEAMKPELNAKYVSDVRKAARKAGLPEPAFIAHHPRGDYPFSDFAPGGARAIQGVRQSQMRLHALGIADTHPQRYIQSLARTIKYAHNWPTVANQAERHSFDPHEFGSKDELSNILGRHVNPEHLSIEDWRRVLHSKRLDPRDYAFWSPGRLRQARDVIDEEGHPLEHLEGGLSPEGAPGVHEGWQNAAVDDARLRSPGGDVFLRTRGWKLIPKAVYDEIAAGTKPSGLGGRLVSKVQGFQSRVLLGTNPSWLQMQVAANMILTGFGAAVKGSLHPVEAQRWYSGLSPEAKQAADEALSLGVLQEHGAYSHLGASTDAKIVGWVRGLGELPAFQKAKRANPVQLLFKGDDAQNKFFRKTLLYSSVKRQALNDMGKGIAGAYEHQKKIAGIFEIKDPKARMEQIMRNPDLFEQHAEFVNRILGDYSRYTARERRTLKRYTLFYGFTRYALKTLFYTLPVKHPLATAVTAKLAQLHNDEVKDLLGGDQAPWAFSRIFFEKNGKLSSIDLGRVNPVSNPVIGLITQGPKGLAGIFSPAGQEIADQIYGKQLYSQMGYRVKGSAEENPNPDLVTRGRIALNHMLATSFPLRELAKATEGPATQGDDSLFFSPRPIQYKTAQAQGREKERQAARGTASEQIIRDLVPLFIARPDTTRDIIAAQQRRSGQPVTVPGQRAKPGPAPALDWRKVRLGGSVSSVDWSKVRIP